MNSGVYMCLSTCWHVKACVDQEMNEHEKIRKENLQHNLQNHVGRNTGKEQSNKAASRPQQVSSGKPAITARQKKKIQL